MQEQDKKRFSEILRGCAATIGTTVDNDRLAGMWQLLYHLTVAELEQAVGRHMQDTRRGRYFPAPSDILAYCQGSTEISGNEAWSIAIQSFDEKQTVVWTQAMAEARMEATPVWESGDKIGARMTFLAAYERIRNQANKAQQWTVCLGFEQSGREAPIQAAVNAGRLQLENVKHMLPAPAPTGDGLAIAGLITGKTSPERKPSEKFRAYLAELKASIRPHRTTPLTVEQRVEMWNKHEALVIASLAKQEGRR